MERTFPLHTPRVAQPSSSLRKAVAKLYYLRNYVDKAARIQERRRWPETALDWLRPVFTKIRIILRY